MVTRTSQWKLMETARVVFLLQARYTYSCPTNSDKTTKADELAKQEWRCEDTTRYKRSIVFSDTKRCQQQQQLPSCLSLSGFCFICFLANQLLLLPLCLITYQQKLKNMMAKYSSYCWYFWFLFSRPTLLKVIARSFKGSQGIFGTGLYRLNSLLLPNQ